MTMRILSHPANFSSIRQSAREHCHAANFMQYYSAQQSFGAWPYWGPYRIDNSINPGSHQLLQLPNYTRGAMPRLLPHSSITAPSLMFSVSRSQPHCMTADAFSPVTVPISQDAKARLTVFIRSLPVKVGPKLLSVTATIPRLKVLLPCLAPPSQATRQEQHVVVFQDGPLPKRELRVQKGGGCSPGQRPRIC